MRETPNKLIVCKKCNKEFLAKRLNRRFCSQKCADALRYIPKQPRGKFIPCKLCNHMVWTRPCRFTKYRDRFCSREHQVLYQKKSSFNFLCIICNKVVFTQPCQLRLRNRTTCSIICRSKLTRQKVEEKRVKLGYTKHQLDRLERYSPEAEKWRKAVFERDNYTCQMCHVRGNYIEADHIKPFAYFPEIRWELSNGRTLCRKCHDSTKMSAKKMQEIYKTKINEQRITKEN